MTILNDTVLKNNKYLKINFDGGDLSSDTGLLLIKEFACKLSFVKISQPMFKTNDTTSFRYHKDDDCFFLLEVQEEHKEVCGYPLQWRQAL